MDLREFCDHEDFITNLFKTRTFHSLDKIILGLESETLRSFENVNSAWRGICDSYRLSRIQRIRRIIGKITPISADVSSKYLGLFLWGVRNAQIYLLLN